MIKKKMVEFDWDDDFERKLVVLLLGYRTSQKSPGNPFSELTFERALAREFMGHLQSLMSSHAPSLAYDSDIAAAVEGARLSHDKARVRVDERHNQ